MTLLSPHKQSVLFMRVTMPAFLLVILLAACSGQPPTLTATLPQPTQPSTAASTATATRAPASALNFDSIPQSLSIDNLPRLGFDNAPVTVALYLPVDDPASAALFGSAFTTLLESARGAEILLTTLPLLTAEGSTDARGAARAALCAGEQNAFYPYMARAMEWLRLYGDQAYPGSRLVEGVAQLGIDQNLWNQCMTSSRPDLALDEARRLFSNLPFDGRAPLIVVDGSASLPDPDSLNFTIDRAVAAFAADLDRALSEATAEMTEIIIPVDPLTGERSAPPFSIALPDGWQYGYETMLVSDLDTNRTIPLALYTGPVTGGTGTIVVLWAFPNVITETTSATVTTDLWLDGLRLLRLAVIEEGCNIGTDLRREYSIAGLAAVGTQFSAIDCPALPDTRGWFAGINQYGLNYAFFMYTDPIDAMDTAEGELQAILDTIVFNLPPTPAAELTEAP
jgi:hypothetical protein